MSSLLKPLLALLLVAMPASAYAQDMGGDMQGGGMGGMGDEGMGGGRMGGGGMGGGGGHHRGGPSSGSEGGPRMARQMKPISLSDFEKEVRKQFTAADLNHDGFVTLDEIHAAIDAKRDTRIASLFDTVDSNHDHKISPEEFATWQKTMGDPEMVALSHLDGPPAQSGEGDRGRDFAEGALHRIITPITAASLIEADSDHDMKLSAAEHSAYERARFDALDTDKDSEISGEELRAARSAKDAPIRP